VKQDKLNPEHFELHIASCAAGQTALDLLSENAPVSKQKIKNAMKNGAVWLESSNGINRLRRAKKQLAENDTVHLYYDASIQGCTTAAARLIDDQGGYSIWHKPYGMYSQGTKWGDHCTIYRWAEQQLKPQRPAFPVHRLDRAASGLMILAHTKKMAQRFSEMFKNRKIQKQYRAIVAGNMNNIDLPCAIETTIDGKPAISKIISLQQQGKNTTVTIEIESGRKHQIRRQLSAMGHPIVGDRLYGSEDSEENLKLQAVYLKFNCPITDQIREYQLDNNNK